MSTLLPIRKGKYRHSKSGKQYEVLGVALHTENDEQLVIYKPLYPCEYEFFARPAAMFTEEVLIDGKKVKRFEEVEKNT